MIADRIRLARRKAGLSLRELSAAMDDRVTAQAIGKYERGEDIPSSGVLLALAKALERLAGLSARHAGHRAGRRRIQNEGEHDRARPRRMSKPRSWSGSSATCRSSSSSSWTAPSGSARSRVRASSRSVEDAEQPRERRARDVEARHRSDSQHDRASRGEGPQGPVCRPARSGFRIHLPGWPAGE